MEARICAETLCGRLFICSSVNGRKLFGQDKLVGKAAPEMLVRYALSLPICAAVVGMPKLEFLDANIAVAKNFRPLTGEEMKSLPQSVSAQMRASIDRFFRDHVDC